jgi:hypothetical protein
MNDGIVEYWPPARRAKSLRLGENTGYKKSGIMPIKLIERSDSTNPKSPRAVGSYGPSGPEAAI